jgi:hypothetical protein
MLAQVNNTVDDANESPGFCRCPTQENELSTPIDSVTKAQAPTDVQSTRKKSPDSTPSDVVATENVKLSSAAMALLREASETPAQTAKEASGGDVQAKHLLAKRAAEHASSAKPLHVVA